MFERPLGQTGIAIAPIAFGAGPVSQLLVGNEHGVQRETVAAAVAAGIRWFDTAATYGDGRSEENLGRALHTLGLQNEVHVATKVRILPEQLGDIAAATRASIAASLRRLQCDRLTLVQVHNSITGVAGAQPTSLTPAQVLDAGGLLETLDALRRAGLIAHLGLTGLGEPDPLRQVIASGQFTSLQIPYHLLNASAGHRAPASFAETYQGHLIADCQRHEMAVFAIRVLAGGALAGNPPSPHTLKTPFFPLALYERDRARARQLEAALPPDISLKEAAVRFALSHPGVQSVIIGFASPREVAEAMRFAYRGPLAGELLARLLELSWQTSASAAPAQPS